MSKPAPSKTKNKPARFNLFGYERRGDPLASRSVFYRRLAVNGVSAIVLVLISLFVGMAGYHFIAGLAWIDAFQNASMILSGMGPVDVLADSGLYAIYSGLALIATAGVTIAPILHRFLHRFHLEDEADEE
jgi:hypothetical protein